MSVVTAPLFRSIFSAMPVGGEAVEVSVRLPPLQAWKLSRRRSAPRVVTAGAGQAVPVTAVTWLLMASGAALAAPETATMTPVAAADALRVNVWDVGSVDATALRKRVTFCVPLPGTLWTKSQPAGAEIVVEPPWMMATHRVSPTTRAVPSFRFGVARAMEVAATALLVAPCATGAGTGYCLSFLLPRAAVTAG
ncbi:MAG: hypothetical protein M3R38_03015 [Actinomycetota bacterium]|nr:hypothetical protein [Actinomycetota bacterium]